MLKAHRAIESITLDREVAHLKRSHAAYASMSTTVTGGARASSVADAYRPYPEHGKWLGTLKLYKGNVIVAGRDSKRIHCSIPDCHIEDDKGAYDQQEDGGFIN